MNLNQWIEESGYTVKSLAEELGVSLGLVYYWLKRKRIPSLKTMKRLLEISNNQIDANTFYK